VVCGAPWDGKTNLYDHFLTAVGEAREHIRIASAYFVPDRKLTRALLRARERGALVEIITCGKHTDEPLARHASRARWGRLLKSGVRIYEFQPTLFHVKAVIVDRAWVTVGSANFDARSCWLNDELNVVIDDPAVVSEHIDLFVRDAARSKSITLEGWRRRPWKERFTEKFAQLFRRHL
jgi:cardiolipin synthase